MWCIAITEKLLNDLYLHMWSTKMLLPMSYVILSFIAGQLLYDNSIQYSMQYDL